MLEEVVAGDGDAERHHGRFGLAGPACTKNVLGSLEGASLESVGPTFARHALGRFEGAVSLMSLTLLVTTCTEDEHAEEGGEEMGISGGDCILQGSDKPAGVLSAGEEITCL